MLPKMWWTVAQMVTLVGSVSCLVIANQYFDTPPRVATFVSTSDDVGETRIGTLTREMNSCLVLQGTQERPSGLVAVPMGAAIESRSVTVGTQRIPFGEQVALQTLQVPLGKAKSDYQAHISTACINFFGVTDTEPIVLVIGPATAS